MTHKTLVSTHSLCILQRFVYCTGTIPRCIGRKYTDIRMYVSIHYGRIRVQGLTGVGLHRLQTEVTEYICCMYARDYMYSAGRYVVA